MDVACAVLSWVLFHAQSNVGIAEEVVTHAVKEENENSGQKLISSFTLVEWGRVFSQSFSKQRGPQQTAVPHGKPDDVSYEG